MTASRSRPAGARAPHALALRVLGWALVAGGLSVLPATGARAAVDTALTRYPYLTDSVQTSITVNWATDAAVTGTGSVTWGPVGSCAANTQPATGTPITVGTRAEMQWAATIPVTPDTSYCYRVRLGGTDLLGTDASPEFTSQVAAGSTAPFSFAVFGDWGQVYPNSLNGDQTNVLRQLSRSGVRFAVMTGDTGYQDGSQLQYGDLQQTGSNVSGIFGPTYWGVPGRSIPVFNVQGNHGFENGEVQITNWPEQNATAASGGKYEMEPYPSVNGSAPASYPSFWYAFDAGGARFYALTSAWADHNVGTGTSYTGDLAAHWTPSSPEYQWLEADLAAHPNALKLAFWHYPIYSDSRDQKSHVGLQGGVGTLQGLLDQYRVAMAFNGHAHGYERNAADSAGMVSYIFGNGGAALGPLGTCHAYDLYAIASGGTACGSAAAGQANDRVFGFGKVTVDGRTVTVTPTDSLGRTFDVQTYTFPTSGSDTTAPTEPGTLTAVAGAAPGVGPKVDLTWLPSTDAVGVTGYRVYRNASTTPLATLPGTATGYTDTAVTPLTAYTYRVSAVDAAGNESTKASAQVTTLPDGSTSTFAPTDDATIDASQPAVNLGTATKLVVDGSPVNQTLLRFDVGGLTGCVVTSAKLRLTVGTATDDGSAVGGDLYPAATTWSQSTVTYATAPTSGTTKLASLPAPVTLGTGYTVDVTSTVTGNGAVAYLLRSPSSDGARYVSKESGTATTAPQLQVTCSPATADSQPPTTPGNLTATALTATSVALAWTASTDNVGVVGYRVYRNGSTTPLATVGSTATTFTDGTAAPATAYTYQVAAVDAMGNESTPRASVAVSTPVAPTVRTFAPTDDATVDASQPSVNTGTSSRLTVDSSPVNWTLLKFTVTGTSGCTVTNARLRLTVGGTANDNSAYGGDLYATTTSTWSQSTVTYATSPQPGPTKIASVPTAVSLNTAYLFDVTPLVAGDGTVSVLLRSPNSDGARYVSKEGGTATTAPQLQVTC